MSAFKIRYVCLSIGPCSQMAGFKNCTVFKLSPFELNKEQITMSYNSKASVLSIKISLQIFSVYGCLLNCIYQMDNFSFCQENYRIYIQRTFGEPFVTAFTVVKFNFYRIVSLKQMIP